ncbi:fructose-2,6-bisphosphatase [Longilinea arvoryzae]|uniref:Fructose-2,6-bisphosphatase n=1 Tax=Longilinea arvoryzae TaxID=360412 RepID=A0A0K8MY82_9CHLR|nr:histidine phosphatase family protein [Longilinea arvoryzae]GAP15991.1 fructose-2,6-bisphosphatase [Longilinea arvoryzae]
MTALKELFLIRHGEAEHLVRNLTGGWTDVPLTELGYDQARRTGRRLAGLLEGGPFEFYCSDLLRARQTAEIIAAQIGQTAVAAHPLRDINNGLAAYRTRDEARAMRKPLSKPWQDWVPYPKGESWRMVRQRVEPFMEALEGERAVIVSHYVVLAIIVQWWWGLNDERIDATSLDIEPCSLTHLRLDAYGARVIVRLNDVTHLGNSA